jgi:hypothetical protein
MGDSIVNGSKSKTTFQVGTTRQSRRPTELRVARCAMCHGKHRLRLCPRPLREPQVARLHHQAAAVVLVLAAEVGTLWVAQQIAIAEAAMPILGEGRVVRHLAVEAEPAEPAVGEVQVHLLAQPPFGANAVAVANQQHPDEQFGINRRPAGRAIKWRQMAPNL